jgi:hypothetical protein
MVGGRSPGSRAYPSHLPDGRRPISGSRSDARSGGIPGHSGGSAPDSHRLPFTTDRYLSGIILPCSPGLRSAAPQRLRQSGKLCGASRCQTLQTPLLLRQHRKRLPDQPLQLTELSLVPRLTAQRQLPQRRIDPSKRPLEMLLPRPRRGRRDRRPAVIAPPGPRVGAIPLMRAAITRTLGHQTHQRTGQSSTHPHPQSIPPSFHARILLPPPPPAPTSQSTKLLLALIATTLSSRQTPITSTTRHLLVTDVLNIALALAPSHILSSDEDCRTGQRRRVPNSGRRLCADQMEVGIEIAQRRSCRGVEHRLLGEQAPRMVEVLRAPECERRHDAAVLQIPVGEAAILE